MPSFERRYIFTGRLNLSTALHIGGGRGTLAPTDSPIVRSPDLLPFIPGSSLKGSFRSTVEKLATAVGLRTCALIEDAECPGAFGQSQRAFNQRREEEGWSEAKLMAALDAELCDTCKLFGSHYKVSKIYFDDLPLIDWAGATQIRDGVAIDRDSEKAVDRLKYDYEVVPPDTSFRFRVTLEEPSDAELALACIGMTEFTSGFGGVGGLRSRGLGRCALEEPAVHELDLRDNSTRAERLKNYLLGATLDEKMIRLSDAATFFQQRISALLEG